MEGAALSHVCKGAVLTLEQNPVEHDQLLAGDMAGKTSIISLSTGTPIFEANAHSKYVVRARWSACGKSE